MQFHNTQCRPAFVIIHLIRIALLFFSSNPAWQLYIAQQRGARWPQDVLNTQDGNEVRGSLNLDCCLSL